MMEKQTMGDPKFKADHLAFCKTESNTLRYRIFLRMQCIASFQTVFTMAKATTKYFHEP
jgi:hypothetical protein